jgi:hypothetical protein
MKDFFQTHPLLTNIIAGIIVSVFFLKRVNIFFKEKFKDRNIRKNIIVSIIILVAILNIWIFKIQINQFFIKIFYDSCNNFLFERFWHYCIHLATIIIIGFLIFYFFKYKKYKRLLDNGMEQLKKPKQGITS